MKTLKTALFAGIALSMAAGSAFAEDTLRLGMTPEPYMPFTQVNAGGEWEGLEADLSRAVCEKMAVKCDINQMAWDGLIPSLKENKVDFIIGAFSITDERRQVVDFSAPYYTEGTSFVGAKADTSEIKTVDAADGSGKIIDPADVVCGIRAIYGDDFRFFRWSIEPDRIQLMDNAAQSCLRYLRWIRLRLLLGSSAIAADVRDKNRVPLLDLELMRKQTGQVLPDRSQDAGVVVGWLIRFHLLAPAAAWCNIG